MTELAESLEEVTMDGAAERYDGVLRIILGLRSRHLPPSYAALQVSEGSCGCSPARLGREIIDELLQLCGPVPFSEAIENWPRHSIANGRKIHLARVRARALAFHMAHGKRRLVASGFISVGLFALDQVVTNPSLRTAAATLI